MDTQLMQTFFWSQVSLYWFQCVIIQLERTPSVRTFVYYRPAFRSQHYGEAGQNRLTEITTTAGMLM